MQYQTVSALLTATAQHESAGPATPPRNPTEAPSLSPLKSQTPSPAQTDDVVLAVSATQVAMEAQGKQTSKECDFAHPGRPIDITIPDDTVVRPGEYFSKTWRLVNGGSCVWDHKYSVVWFSGDDLGISRAQRFNSEIVPGMPIDLTVDMVAPEIPGTYQSNWKLRNSKGELFGIGPNGDAPFWARIIVVPIETATVIPTVTLPTSTSTSTIRAEGSVVLKIENGFDLDSGTLNQPDEDDLRFEYSAEEAPVLSPVDHALVVPFGVGRPGFNDCLLAPLSAETIRLDLYQPGMYFCYRTSRGLPGWFLLSDLKLQTEEASLEFLTWSMP